MTPTRDPLEPGRPFPLLGWLRGATRRERGRRVPAWVLTGATIAVTVGLGAWGFSRLPLNPKLTLLESLYRAVKLYTLDLGPTAAGGSAPPPNWQIWVALLLAAALVLRAVLALARARVRRVATRYVLRGHVIVCGGGVHGTALVSALSGGRGEHDPPAEKPHDVVLVDPDAGSIGMQAPFGVHEWRMVGDAVGERMLLAAGAAHADSIVAMTGDDFVNSQIVSTIRSLAQQGRIKDRVHVLVQIEDPSLARFLEEETALPGSGPVPVVSPFGANAIAAETLIRDSQVKLESGECEPFLRMRDGRAPSLLLAGDHPLIDALVLSVLRHWRVRGLRELERGTNRHRPPVHVSVLGPGAVARVEAIRRRWRPESHVLTIEAYDTGDGEHATADTWESRTYEWLRKPGRADHTIVACLDELDGVRFTLELDRALGDGVLMTRVTTQLESVLDEHLSDRLAATEVRSIAQLGCRWDQMRRLAAQQRLADALDSPPDRPDLGLPWEKASTLSSKLFYCRSWLDLHSDSTWRVLPSEQPLLQPLLRPIRLSALLWAGLTVDLGSRENLRRCARRLTLSGRSGDALVAWCEYARRVQRESLPELVEEVKRFAPGDPPGRLLRLRAFTLGASRAIPVPAHEHILRDAPRVGIFAGGANSMSSSTIDVLRPFLKRALMGYDGIVLSGGTSSGLPGAIGEVARDLDLRCVGYVPAGRGDPDLYARLRETTGEDEFSVREPLAMWEDVLGSGIPLSNVRVVVFPGGPITITELLLARALGAQVAWLDPSGEAAAPLEDMLPLGAEPVLEPPSDSMTLRAFLVSSRLPAEIREPVAQHLHNAYRRRHRKRKHASDPALAPWDDLIPSLQYSNLAQADDIPNKLAMIGKRLSNAGEPLTLDEAEIGLLAELEHGRYNIERLSAGWELGERAVGRSVSPFLKPWDELSGEAQEYDREAVTNIAPALADVGWGVVDGQRPVYLGA